MTDWDDLRPIAAGLLRAIGHDDSLFRIEPLRGGNNNRVARLRIGATTYILKVYFRDPDDPRDRLASEAAFAAFAWQHGVRCVHHPLAIDRAAHATLFSDANGRPFAPGEVGMGELRQATDFVLALNEHRTRAAHLAAASEACFSIAEHIASLDRRVIRLKNAVPDPAARRFIHSELAPAWKRLRNDLLRAAGKNTNRALSPRDRCLSPSDFGFHNAVADAHGRITFFDFEYAGWDDPARMVCDFFCQIAVPAPAAALPTVTARIADIAADKAWFHERVALLMPVYRLKWCCIILNDFLPRDRRRRMFAGTRPDAMRLTGQLAKAHTALAGIVAPTPAHAGSAG